MKIRGIYATALTAFFLERGLKIASPSEEIAWRFRDREGVLLHEDHDVEIADLEGRQGIMLRGPEDKSARIVALLKNAFPDPIFRKGEDHPLHTVEIEIPYLTKSALDEERHTVLPTLFNHHRLRIIDPEALDLVEGHELTAHPDRRKALSEEMERRLIWEDYTTGKEVRIEHVKLNGQVLFLSEGEVVRSGYAEKRLVLKRSRFRGRSRYDGLNIPKQEGDYAVSDIREGERSYRHSYFRANGDLIGTYHNINTPVEFYPDKIRYVDLEIDVVQWPDGRTEIIDEPLLEKQFESGCISRGLMESAKKAAHCLKKVLAEARQGQ